MKICFITPTFGIGGYEKFLLNIIEGLNKEYKIYTIAINGTGELYDDFKKVSIVKDLQCDRVRNSFFKLLKVLKEINPDLVYTSFSNINTLIFFINKIIKNKFKIIIGEHLITNPKNTIDKFILNYVYENVNSIIAVSRFTKNKIVENLDVDANKIKVIYNPIINKTFLKNYNEEYKHKWLNENYVSIVLIGRIEKDKGFQYILEAFSKLKTKKNIRFIIVGDGSYTNTLKELCYSNDIAEFVDFIGFKKNPIKILKNADIHFVLSDYETFGNTVIEASYCGCKIITYKGVGGPEEILSMLRDGKVLKDRHIRTIIESLKNLDKKSNFYNNDLSCFYEEKVLKEYINEFNKLKN
ncbi:glycosyltransferase [Clostridium perfringens]|nr:glycosyltransferase [Clostridium perfringens]MDK0410521.1 glycosyltransferase [Clostridium perfringens]MDK0444773.1 glycosyltransferase [Clostridium perfringens]MDK0498509.1 glycosyltransferase [Clostridium perfringens]MDK0501429.1 glycosyltransferase [Clostridium perfringens]